MGERLGYTASEANAEGAVGSSKLFDSPDEAKALIEEKGWNSENIAIIEHQIGEDGETISAKIKQVLKGTEQPFSKYLNFKNKKD